MHKYIILLALHSGDDNLLCMRRVIAEVAVPPELYAELPESDTDSLPKKRIEELRQRWFTHLLTCEQALQEYFGPSVNVSTHVSNVALDVDFPENHPAHEYDRKVLIEEVKKASANIWKVSVRGEEDDAPMTTEEFLRMLDIFVDEEH